VVKDIQHISVLHDLQTGQPAERAQAAKIFRETGDHRIVRFLSKALNEDDDPSVRLEAVQALAKLAGRKDLKSMLKALRDPDPRVAQAALEALSTYQSNKELSEQRRREWARELVKLLKGDNAQGRLYAADLLMALGQEASSQVTPLLKEKGETAQVALDILTQVGDENAIAHLLYHLDLPKADTVLTGITRKRFGEKPDRWKTWWNRKKPRIVEQPTPKRPGP
jgi:HEAT repeat protein